ncbi:MAG: DUF4345 family protein [Proteobacteria bacterium]|jgi:hypothetical protein|nr:DUF4345 family protein [Pseudomonadota bacterium]MDA0949288.1 DUF4345 family protein [Pseudomonadota bacterium]MDA1083164.1 DUF4345 family protein [Pseudomonadota bacterium]MDC1242174.1 DUF4345 family protein [Gammaproteobacteria bacterium]
MLWIVRLYLFLMGLIYLAIGVWAIFDSLFDSLPSFMEAVGLSVTSEIGYSEIAGLYGGLNICIGFMCLLGLFKEEVGVFSIQFLTFLTGSIASGRVIYSFIPATPSFFNTFFIFEIIACLLGLWFLRSFKKLDQVA